jgi:hypothetical protein
MALGTRIINNLSAFLIGIFLVLIITFLIIQSGFMTANIQDGLLYNIKDSQKDFILSFESGILRAIWWRDLVINSWESLRFDFHYNPTTVTTWWSWYSSYRSSFDFHDGILSIIILPWDTTINKWKELFNLSTNITQNTDMPIIDTVLLYGEDFVEPMNSFYHTDNHY